MRALIGIARRDYKAGFLAAVLPLFCALQACVSIDETRLTPGVFDLATPANRFINSENRARVILALRARELCPNGYSRSSESRIVDAKGIETMIWRIRCND